MCLHKSDYYTEVQSKDQIKSGLKGTENLPIFSQYENSQKKRFKSFCRARGPYTTTSLQRIGFKKKNNKSNYNELFVFKLVNVTKL